jgi:GH15 family glucan-1,4-alpha-glucosidase
MARYLPIAKHGLIGDLHTVALVGTDGTIDWYGCPRFDSPTRRGAARVREDAHLLEPHAAYNLDRQLGQQ